MVIVHWFWNEIILTYREIRQNVTIPHIFTGVVLYWIVHTAAKNGQKSAKRVEHLFKTEAQRLIYIHTHAKHQGKPVDCPDCATIVTVEETTV